MKALNYITILALLVLMSCSTGLYTGVENDDLYFQPSDQSIARVKTHSGRQLKEDNLKSQDYYSSIYAADTLVSDEYNDATDYKNYEQNNYNFYDNYSYSGRLRNFYGNYFYPYWRDPFYSSWGYPYMGFGYSPYSYFGSPYAAFMIMGMAIMIPISQTSVIMEVTGLTTAIMAVTITISINYPYNYNYYSNRDNEFC